MMSLIMRQNRETREQRDNNFTISPNGSPAAASSRQLDKLQASNATVITVAEKLESSTQQQQESCDTVNSSTSKIDQTTSFDDPSTWNTYWRQMDGPPPYKTMMNRETFKLVLNTVHDNSTEIRYYVEEPLERDPHCLTSDRAQAKIRIGPKSFYGVIVADWTYLTNASMDETVLTLAVDFSKKIPMSVEQRTYHSTFEVDYLLFFLFGFRHGLLDDDYKKECPVDCPHAAHRLGLTERKLPIIRFKYSDLKDQLRFVPRDCIIPSPSVSISYSSGDEMIDFTAPTKANGNKVKSKIPALKFKTTVAEKASTIAAISCLASSSIQSSLPPQPSPPKKGIEENEDAAASAAAAATTPLSTNIALYRSFQLNRQRSKVVCQPDDALASGSKRRMDNDLSTSSEKKRKCFTLDDGDDVSAVSTADHSASKPKSAPSLCLFKPPAATNFLLCRPTPTNEALPTDAQRLTVLEKSIVGTQRFKSGNLYAKKKCIGNKSSYYMYVPPSVRKVQPAIRDSIGYINLDFPLLGKLVFFLLSSASSHFALYRNFAKMKDAGKWIHFSPDAPNIQILESLITPHVHGEAQLNLFSEFDKAAKKIADANKFFK